MKNTEPNDSIVAAIHGRVNTMPASDFKSGFMEVLDSSVSRLIPDCGEFDYINSSGLNVFLVAQKRMMAGGGKLKLCCLKPEIKEIYDIYMSSSIFAISTDLGTATAN